MSEINRKEPVFDPAIQTENLAFEANEMIACRGCGRANPPNRHKCLYCARELEIKAEHAAVIKPVLRKLEPWERGFNVILTERKEQAQTAKIAKLFSADATNVAAMLENDTPLPLARVESEADAAILKQNLEALGLECLIVSDADLESEKPPARLNSITFGDGQISLRDFNTEKITHLQPHDLALSVTGILVTGKVESLEKRRRRGKETKVIDETATGGDEPLLDLYTRTDKTGFRVHLAGFDFSGLGDDKGLLAAENLRTLIIALKEHSPDAKLVSNYAAVRHFLDDVWEIESRKDPQGLRRSGFGKVEFGTVASTSNLAQFTKFSRLQWHLL